MKRRWKDWRMPIRLALVAGFLITCGAPLLGYWYWSFSAILKHEVEEVHERHLLLARNLGAALERYHSDVTSAFEAFSERIGSGGDPSFARTMFLKLEFRHVCEPPRVYRRVKLSKDEPYGQEEAYAEIHGRIPRARCPALP